MAVIKNLIVRAGADFSELEKELASASKKISKAGKELGKVGKSMTMAVTLPIVGIGIAMGKSAMDLEATEAKYNTVFGEMTKDADDFIKKFQELTPATTASARSMASGIQDLLVPMGFARDEATKMTGETMHLVGALTNFNSATHSAEDVANAFQSALTGSYEPLKRLGIQVSKEQVTNKAYEMGLVEVGGEVTKAMEAQALMALAYEQSGDALAGYTEANLDAKTKMGLMKAELTDVAASFGQHLLPIINNVIDALRRASEWFGGLTEEQQKTILVVGAVVAAIGPLLIIAGKMMTGLSAIITVGKSLGVVLTGLKAAFAVMTGPIGLVIIAIAAAIAIGVLLYKNWDTIKEYAQRLWVWIKEKFTAVKDAIMNPIQEAMDFISNINLFDAGKKIINGLVDGIKNAGNSVKEAASNVAGKIRDFFPFSPAKEGPLKDLNKLNFGGVISHSIEADTSMVQKSLSNMLELPSSQRESNAGQSGNVVINMYNTVRSDSDIQKISYELNKEMNKYGRAIGVSV
ncbi:MAG: hypothetical protein KMY55_09905 [Dethiosulfatibacter sp.]|nr:hypothetical protein [Dethiosulfatibacter sp.]